jgi:hypothetical protein
VRERRRIDNRTISAALESLDRFDQLAFVIRLNPGALDPEFSRARLRRAFDFGEALTAVDLRFAFTQQIQIGAIQHGNMERH